MDIFLQPRVNKSQFIPFYSTGTEFNNWAGRDTQIRYYLRNDDTINICYKFPLSRDFRSFSMKEK